MSRAQKVIDGLNSFIILVSLGMVVWGCSMLIKDHDVYNTPNTCPDHYKNMYIYLWISVGIAMLGVIYKIPILKCGMPLYWTFHILNIAILGYNTYILSDLSSSCKSFYHNEYYNIWILFIGVLIYQLMVLLVGLINLIYYILGISNCIHSDEYYY